MAAVLASRLVCHYLATSALNEVASVFLGEPTANCYDAAVLLLPAAIPTPAGTRAGIDLRWVTVPVTGRRHGRRHGRATEPIAQGLW